MNTRFLCVLLFVCSWLCLLNAQPRTTCIDRYLEIEPAGKTLLQWFNFIEKNANIKLSYNSSSINLNEIYNVNKKENVRVDVFMYSLLSDYNINFNETSPGKLLLQITPKNDYWLEGTVIETESNEKLFDAYVFAVEKNTGKIYTVYAKNGTFRIKVKEGEYNMRTNYMGYVPNEKAVNVFADSRVTVKMKPVSFELKETMVRPDASIIELDESHPSNRLNYTNSNLFSQMNILPGVIGAPMGAHFQVNGGGDDENLLLIDGIPLFYYGHLNNLMSPFNGDMIKNITFYRSYFPTTFEGRISSVTDVRIKEGNKNKHGGTFSLDMPAASLMLEGPLLKNKISYIVGLRRSWLDFFDELVSDKLRTNHSYYDFQAKLSYDITPFTSIQTMVYHAADDYHYPVENTETKTLFGWNNSLYNVSLRSLFGDNLSFNSSLAYATYSNKSLLGTEYNEEESFIKSGISSLYFTGNINFKLNDHYSADAGIRLSGEKHNMLVFGDDLINKKQGIFQTSLFYENTIYLSSRLQVNAGVNYVIYLPDNNKAYNRLQPRFNAKYSIDRNNMIYAAASRMEQFYHYIGLTNISLPTDFRMPSINGVKPRSSEHYELGWKHFLDKGYLELSAFYKSRHNVLALRPEVVSADKEWEQFMMTGNGMSYGFKSYISTEIKKLSFQMSYSFIRSKERFEDINELGVLPSLYDVPHTFAGVFSYQINANSSVSLGGELQSGVIKDFNDNEDDGEITRFRKYREPLKYRIDAGYGFQKTFKKSIFAFRIGLYSILGNPSAEDIQSFYFVNYQKNCLPYFTVSLKI